MIAARGQRQEAAKQSQGETYFGAYSEGEQLFGRFGEGRPPSEFVAGAQEEMLQDARDAGALFSRFVAAGADEMDGIRREMWGMLARHATDGNINEDFYRALMQGMMGQAGIVRAYAEDLRERRGLREAPVLTLQDFSDLMDRVSAIAARMEAPGYELGALGETYGRRLVEAVQPAREQVHSELAHTVLAEAFDPNDFISGNFDPRNWLAVVFSEENVTVTSEPGIQEVFANFVGRLQELAPKAGETAAETAERGGRIVEFIESAYKVDLSQMDSAAKERMVSRVEQFLGIMVQLATLNTPEGAPVYDTFVENLINARFALTEMLQRLGSARDRDQLLMEIRNIRESMAGTAEQAIEAYRGLRPEFYGAFADYIIDQGIIGTSIFGMRAGEEAAAPRSIIGAELGLSPSEQRGRGLDFLLAAYEKIGTERFFRDRQRMLDSLNGQGVQPLVEGGELPEEYAGEPLGDRLLGATDLLGQHALIRNRDVIFRYLNSPRMIPGPEGETADEAQAREAQEAMAHEEQYVEAIARLAGQIAPGSAFFLFHSALPIVAQESSDAEDFFRMCDAMATALDQLTGYNSLYLFYGSQDSVDSYLHVQVPAAVRETTSGARAMTETLARFVSMYPEAEDFRRTPSFGAEPVLPVTGPIPPLRGVWRNYVDWAFGATGSRFQNLPIEMTALSFPQELNIGAGFQRLEYLIPATLGLGANVDNSAAALAALVAAMNPSGLYNETEFGSFMRNQYINIVKFFQPPQDVRVTFHTGGRPSFYRPFDLYSRLAMPGLGLPPIIPEAVWSPARGAVEAGARIAGGEGLEERGAAAAAVEARGPTAGGAGGAMYRAAETGEGEVTAGAEVSTPQVEATAVAQGAWYEQENNEAVLARLNGMGEDSDYGMLFDFVRKEEEGEEGFAIRAYTYGRIGEHWYRFGYYQMDGDREALGRFANTLVSNLGPLGLAGYKYDASEGMVSFTGVMGNPEEIAGFGLAGNTEEIFSTVTRYAHLGEAHLAAGGVGFLLGQGFSLGLVGRGAAVAEDDEGHGGALVVIDYNKQSTRVTGSVGFDWNPVSYTIQSGGELGVMTHQGGFLSASLAARGMVDEANFWETYLKGYLQVTPSEQAGETMGLEVGGLYSKADLTIRATGSYEQWLRSRAEGEEADLSRMGGGALEISWKSEGGVTTTIRLGGEYSTDYLMGSGVLRFNQEQMVGQLFRYWEEYTAATDPEESARSLYNFGRTLKTLARIRRMSSQGVESLRESCDLMAAGSLVIETAEHMVSFRGVGVRGARGLEGEGEYGGVGGVSWTMESDRTSLTLSGNFGQAPTGLYIWDASGIYERRIGEGGALVAGATFSRNVWEEWGAGGILGGRTGRSQYGVQGSYLWGGNQGVDYVWNIAPYYAYTGEEAEWRAALSVGGFGLSVEEEGAERRAFEARQVGAQVEVRYPEWSLAVGGNVIPAGGLYGGGLAVEGSWRDVNRYLESIGVRGEYQQIGGIWYLTFQAVGRF